MFSSADTYVGEGSFCQWCKTEMSQPDSPCATPVVPWWWHIKQNSILSIDIFLSLSPSMYVFLLGLASGHFWRSWVWTGVNIPVRGILTHFALLLSGNSCVLVVISHSGWLVPKSGLFKVLNESMMTPLAHCLVYAFCTAPIHVERWPIFSYVGYF